MEKTAFIFALIIIPVVAVAQKINYPSDPEQTKLVLEKLALFSDDFREGDYINAQIPLDWLLEHYPDVSPNIYINGIKLYENLEKSENDLQKQQVLQEKILWLYDQRMLYFNDVENVINRKSHAAYKYFRNREEKYRYLLQIFDDAFQSDQKYIFNAAPMAYMDVIVRFQNLNHELGKEDILERYNRISSILKSKAESKEAINEIDKMLLSIVDMDCEEISDRFGPESGGVDDELEKAKKYMAISLAYKCSNHPMFLKAAMIVFHQEPTIGLAKIIAMLSEANRDYANAENYLHKALELGNDSPKTNEIHLMLAEHFKNRDMKQKSRYHALKAAGSSELRSKAYRLIGDLYYYSSQNCTEGKSPLADRSIYLAAYEMYQKAGDENMMKTAKEQFPSDEDIHADNKKEGDQVTVGCWINENVTIRKR